MVRNSSFLLYTALSMLKVTAAHVHGAHFSSLGGINASGPSKTSPPWNSTSATVVSSSLASASNYYAYHGGTGLLIAHVILMVIAWILVLPLGKL